MINSGVDGDNDVFPIRVNNLGHQYVLLTDGTNSVHFCPIEETTSLYTTPGRQGSFHVHICKTGIVADTGLMVIDLSDTTNWPHTNTDRISLFRVSISIAASKLFDGSVSIGWLSDVDATDGDFNAIHCWEVVFAGTNEPRDIDQVIDYQHINYDVHIDKWFGPTSANNVLFQTDVDLYGPDGNTSYPSGNGDLVLYIQRTAGEIDVSLSVDYDTHAT